MKQIKILGTGCPSCKTTEQLVRDVVAAKGIDAEVGKVEDLPSIMQYGVMSTPGVVIDGKVVHSGGIPNRAQIEEWLA